MKEKKTFYRSYQHIDNYSNKRKTQVVKSYGRQVNCFDTEEESIQHYEAAWQEAQARHEKSSKLLKDLMAAQNFDISYEMDGDTYGIHLDYLFINIDVQGYSFRFIMK